MKSKNETSPLIPENPDDPAWPESREERCAGYIATGNWYRLFWQLRAIQRASRYASEDATRNDQRRRGR
jgi:hypothetical protein